jgi:hypothetical protein
MPDQRLGSSAPSVRRLRAASDDELIATYDEIAKNTVVGTAFYLEELQRREAMRISRSMWRLTWWIFGFTAVVTVATVVNVVLFVRAGL